MPGTSYEPVDHLSSCTLKRHPKMDLNKADMLQLLSYLEGELQARDVVIATLKAEKAKHFLYEAKYGRFGGLGDPLHALQRDSELTADSSFDESAVKAMYDDQLTQLDNLISTQHHAQQQMREQLGAVDKRFHKVCVELEEEKSKHARDMEQGDNVTYMLEKDRERLKQELEFEKSQNKKLERELKRASTVHDEDRAASAKHKQVALMLIRGRTRLVQALVEARAHCAELENAIEEARRAEASNEERHVEADFEREQLRARLSRAEAQNRELRNEIERLRGLSVSRPTASHPHVYISERTVSPTPPNSSDMRRTPVAVSVPKLSPEMDSSLLLRTVASPAGVKKSPVLHEISSSAPSVVADQMHPKISTNVGPVVTPTSVNAARKPVPAGRGVPPPVPPNKPHMVISPQGSAARPATPVRPVAAGQRDRMPVVAQQDGVVNHLPSPRLVTPGIRHPTSPVRPESSSAMRKPGPVNIKSQVG